MRTTKKENHKIPSVYKKEFCGSPYLTTTINLLERTKNELKAITFMILNENMRFDKNFFRFFVKKLTKIYRLYFFHNGSCEVVVATAPAEIAASTSLVDCIKPPAKMGTFVCSAICLII